MNNHQHSIPNLTKILPKSTRKRPKSIKFARPCAYRRVRSLKISLFLFQLANFPFFQQPLAFQLNFLFLVSSTKSRARPPQGPRFSKIHSPAKCLGRLGASWPHLGPIFPIFDPPERHQKIMFFLHRSKRPKKSIMNGPRSIPEPFWELFSWILGAILASIFRCFWGSILHRFFIDFLQVFGTLESCKK